MSTLNQIFTTGGLERNDHAAVIANASFHREEYDKIHAAVFEKNGLEKYVVVNADGKIIEKKSAVKFLTNASGTVRHEDFMVIQDKIVEVRRRSLNGIADLMSAGLTFSESISKELIGFETINEFSEAKQEMNPNVSGNNDSVFGQEYVPNPITHLSFSVPWRQEGFDYKRSLGLSESVRQVSERLENTLFNGNSKISVNFAGKANPIYGYTNHPKRGQGTISDWSAIANIEEIVPEAVSEIGKMWSTQGGVANDSVVMYVSNDIWPVLQNDYKADSEKSVYMRLLQIPQLKEIKPAEKMAAKSVMLVEMQDRTVQMAVASDIITIPHLKTNPMSSTVLTTYAAMVAQIKVDAKGNTGIRHLTTS